ncbi:pseudouridine synthase [Algivirga pacifica]|uniref:tRNA pseudouridine synthase C n=1 Tax=Algivirga pacifica TaxID=1162670 RepID=A0ABP9D375_9BACT
MTKELEILYRDEHYIAVNKPSGMLVHRTELAEQQGEFAMMRLRDQIGQHVYTCHRLDRPTSGVLIFALSSEGGSKLQTEFAEQRLDKRYLCVVRGHTLEEGVIDKAVKSRYSKEYKTALSTYKTLEQVELEEPVGRYNTARYSLVEVFPKTGRTHQIRLHMKGLNHPLIGDTRYGDHRHNKVMSEKYGCHRLMLHAAEMRMRHPYTGEEVHIEAALPESFLTPLSKMGFKY